ncbi:carbohydrate-binding module family 43 protein [Stemphylium lycopersici]|uniref:1,3-beta-glucanosyltransferase n=1 Tax=Stemphylium lycopersici TaxID=183478 RepID=A0A364N517_STELY|nr:carbohydrate-binding module family 43 protein [Stemphylium lycopersici]RAR09593.1 carbohydrate-binding module family 43 protein [Stemphylium lycopersici]RAR12132.1 carbohydrate-binding module family 43 protein [Stemphylium lycopersici]
MRGVIATAALLAGVQAAVDPIVIKGQKFFQKNSGEQFFMKGVAYQQEVNSNTTSTDSDSPDITDPLADSSACKRDIVNLKKLDTNTIRVYAIDPEKDHEDCMTQLADAGIYVVADLSEPGKSINRDDPGWTVELYQRYTSVVDEMMKYDNTLGFFAGNEVSNQPNNTVASAFVKAAVRDTKAYIKSKNYREIGVGYATNDDADIRENMANYFDCGDPESAIDFWGYNIYSWCGDSSFTKSGYDVQTKNFEKYNVPVFFAEYGCNTPRPREFTEVKALYGKDMTDVWSGGIVYMYFEEENEYGLASIKNGKAVTNEDFDNLSKQIAKATPSGVKMSDYNPSNTAAAKCPKVTSGMWEAESDPLPPVANANLCSCMMETLECEIADDTDEDDFGDIFGFLCGEKDGEYCQGINKNATSGPYGVYGMCSSKEQLSFAANAYAKDVRGGCDFKGKATTKSAVASPTASGCSSLLKEAGTDGTGSVKNAAAGATGSSASGSSGADSTGAASALSAPYFSNGAFGLGLYVVGAVASGMAMILL